MRLAIYQKVENMPPVLSVSSTVIKRGAALVARTTCSTSCRSTSAYFLASVEVMEEAKEASLYRGVP
jgi:hypothetical protein